MRALPREAVIDHRHLIGSTLPFPNQPSSRFQLGTSAPPDLTGLVELLCNLAELTLPLRAEAAESHFLHPVCDSSYQQLAAEMRRCVHFVEGAPLLTKLAEVEFREARAPPGKPKHPGPRGSCLLRRGDAVDPAALLRGRGKSSDRASSSGFPRRARGPCAAASPLRSPLRRLLRPRVAAASRSPRPALTGASRRTVGPGRARLRSPTTADRSTSRGQQPSSASRHRGARSTAPPAACR